MSFIIINKEHLWQRNNRESSEGYSKLKVAKRHCKFLKASPDYGKLSKSLKGTESRVQKGKLSLLACHTRCKYSSKTTRKCQDVI